MFVTESEGFKWIIRPGTDDMLGPGHERFLNDVMKIPENGVFIDIGAHVGHFSIRLSKTASQVIAIEPGDVQVRGLIKNINLNNIQNIKIVQAAASDHDGKVNLFIPRAGNYGQMRIQDSNEGLTSCYKLDTLILGPSHVNLPNSPLERIDLIKVDVQGAEAKVLAGMHEVVSKYKPRLVIELHDKEFNDPSIWEGVQGELAKLNYTWTFINEAGTNWWIEANEKL